MTTASSSLRLMPLELGATRLTEGFWSRWQRLNREVTIPLGAARLEEAGHFRNFRVAAGLVQAPHEGPVYQDSDLYKWLEAIAWERGREDSKDLAESQEEVVDLIVAAQGPDGYINTYYQAHPDIERFSDLAHGHELYCAGHLIQAAVASCRSAGDARLLEVAVRLADYLVSVFGPDKRHGVCGHPEIEMALVDLYRVTGEERYLALASYFVDARGYGLVSDTRFGPAYFQDRTPVRQAASVEGHAVRALYLAAGATDVAIETGDTALLQALEHQWAQMVATKTYITGGLGSHWEGEAFGEAYELPTSRAYCETCAAIGSIFWTWRLLLATGDRRYADLIERTLHNAVINGLSLDGGKFFYVNPLQLCNGDDGISSRSPGRGRQTWFGTACCPTNLMRFIASIQQYFLTHSGTGVQVHQFATGLASSRQGPGPISLSIQTDYPWSGDVNIVVVSSPAAPWELSVRNPDWCAGAQLTVNGAGALAVLNDPSYLRVARPWKSGDRVVLHMPLAVRRTRAIRAVEAVYGSVALERGPLVYCIEQQDCPGGDLDHVRLHPVADESVVPGDTRLGGVAALDVPVVFVAGPPPEGLPYSEHVEVEHYGSSTRAIAIPYYAWANRDLGPMRTWIPIAETPSRAAPKPLAPDPDSAAHAAVRSS